MRIRKEFIFYFISAEEMERMRERGGCRDGGGFYRKIYLTVGSGFGYER
jgi:hypothetical protein